MCGIAGIIGNNASENLRLMLNETIHRGPDDHGFYNDEYCSIGMNRLSIIDRSNLGHQPMHSEDNRYVIVYNGETYNFLEIKKKLIVLGYIFRSNTDTEVILKAFEHYGNECVNHFRGMFAFAIWDKWEKKLFAARDHFGIKPFIYTLQNGRLVFCSELKGFKYADIKIEISPTALSEYLALGYVSSPNTIYTGIFCLLPGHALEYAEGNLITWKYWQLSEYDALYKVDFTEAIQTTRSLVIDAVKEQMISDVPLGIFLSGGLDSSIQVAAMREAGVETINSYSVGFDAMGSDIDESNDALIAARFYNTNHHHLNITSEAVPNLVCGYLNAMDQPSVDGLNTYCVSSFAKQGVTVALSGLGADELFGGYTAFKRILSKPGLRVMPFSYATINYFPNSLSPKLYNFLKHLLAANDVTALFSQLYRYISSAEIAKLISEKGYTMQKIDYEIYKNFTQLTGKEGNTFQKIVDLFLKTHMLSRLLKDADIFSMTHSLEVRVPFLDFRIADYAYNLPVSLHFTNYSNPKSRSYEADGLKRILYNGFKKDLPADFSSRSKTGFSMPFENWLRQPLKELVMDTLNGPETNLNKQEVLKSYNLWASGKTHWSTVWSLFVYTFWYQQQSISK